MLERLLEWPARGPDQADQDFDNTIFHSTEDIFQHSLANTAGFYREALTKSPKLDPTSCQYPTSETWDTMEHWGHDSHTPTIRRPAPYYPPGYSHELERLSFANDCTVPGPGEATTNPTPALTDSHSPVVEDYFTYAPEPVQHEAISQNAQTTSFTTHVPPGALGGDEFTLSVRETQAQVSGCYQPSGLHHTEPPTFSTPVGPLRFSRENYDALLQAHGPIPQEVKVPSDREPYSFMALDRKGCHPVISIAETGGVLSGLTIDLKGEAMVLTAANFCRVPGCGYWAKNHGRVPRHRLTHFTDRGYECRNPYRRGQSAPRVMQCVLVPGQYITRLDLFKKHCGAPSCREYTPPSFDKVDCWRGPEIVDEVYLLPFTRGVHLPFILRIPRTWSSLAPSTGKRNVM